MSSLKIISQTGYKCWDEYILFETLPCKAVVWKIQAKELVSEGRNYSTYLFWLLSQSDLWDNNFNSL